MNVPFVLPSLSEGAAPPTWNGHEFLAQGQPARVLCYSANVQGWHGALTAFHEHTAGAAHPIDTASRASAVRQLAQHLTSPTPTLLEIGSSSGFLLPALQQQFPRACLIGSDCAADALETAATTLPGIPLLQFDLLACPLPASCVDGVVMLNVLEHIARDDLAVQQVYRILKPGGILALEVPAGPSLYDIYDRYLCHYRRYTLRGLRQRVAEAGFEILYQSYLGCFAYPFFALVKKRQRRLLDAPLAEQQRQIAQNIRQTKSSAIFKRLMQCELWLGQYVRYPFGIRCLLTARKPEK